MVHSGYQHTSAKLANGEVVQKNDHIYVSPPWSDRDGTPYMIARIIEFLPADTAPKKGTRPSQANDIQVRISLYYRPSDISGRNVSDFRLLLAAIHTDTQPLSNIRGKCYVRHKDRIEDLLAWKKRPDHFYFVRFFDPYIKREFEVIRTEAVTNIPRDVREALLGRYEYLITEREMIADLTDNYKTCCVCTQWASSQEAVKCEACKQHYHMRCLNPPLLAKPAKGYSWVCPPCSVQRHKDIQEQKFRYGGTSAPVKGAKAAQKKEKNATSSRADVMHGGWPWRYFGQFTSARDTLDPDDLIFPRAATRVGQKFQASVPTWQEQQAIEAAHRSHQFAEGEAGPSRHIAVERGHDVGERKNESTYDVWCTPSDDLNEYMTELYQLRLAVPAWDVERLNKAVSLYTHHGRANALTMMKRTRFEQFSQVVFSEKETIAFEAELERQGGLDTHETAKVVSRTPAEVLRFSYQWKNKRLKIENEALRAHHKVNSAHARQNRTLGAPSLGRIRAREASEQEDDMVSLLGADSVREGKMQCAACSTRLGDVWWRCPRTVQGKGMCASCGANYRKYGVISFVKADDSKRPEKEKAPGVKKTKGDVSGTSTPVPPPAPRLPPCACCRRMEPKSTMARCKNCTFSAHAGCYGIDSQDMGPTWECELCYNVKNEDHSLEPRCVLCPRDNSAAVAKVKAKRPTTDFDSLSALKPTEGRQWAHVLCSAWMPEIIYTQPAKMKLVEGITSLTESRWTTACSLCNQLDGAVIYCSDCDVPFHASCAWLLGYKFGFEFSLAKPGKREVVTIAKFKEEAGVMNPGCWCKGHDLDGRTIYDIHEMDPEQNETALQIYSASYKSLPPQDETFALLRKARRMDMVYPPLPTSASPADKECRLCGVDVSPRWYVDDAVEGDVVGRKRKREQDGDDGEDGKDAQDEVSGLDGSVSGEGKLLKVEKVERVEKDGDVDMEGGHGHGEEMGTVIKPDPAERKELWVCHCCRFAEE